MPDTLTPLAPPTFTQAAIPQELEQRFQRCNLLRPFRRTRYETGHELIYDVTGVAPAHAGRAVLEVERFVGGGFAGQVYRVRLARLEPVAGPLAGLTVGERYAIKILRPPSGFSLWFRDFLFFLGYQAPFSAQAHPAAVRTGVLWQKLIRRAAAARFGVSDAVCDTFATFYDPDLHSFGEINEWVPGRNWHFEVDDRLFDRWKFDGQPPPGQPSAEYVHKKLFMRDFVRLLHEMGAPELARQYEWWTCKSQPNVLKRLSADDEPDTGLTAIDFRAGLALLPFAPMSPADVPLIFRGLARGRLVQFDRSDPRRFRQYLDDHAADFADLEPAVCELQESEAAYRATLPDITRHHVKLLVSSKLRQSIRAGTVEAWRNLGRLDARHATRLARRPFSFCLLYLIWMIPLVGPRLLKLWGDAAYRRHVGKVLSSFNYLRRALLGKQCETLIGWQRAGRRDDAAILGLVAHPVRFWTQRILVGWMPAAWHRALAEPRWAWRGLVARFRFVWDFVRRADFRAAWLLEQVRLGREEGMLTPAEAEHIAAQVDDPFIAKYLKCLAAHLCTLPITHTVMLIVGTALPFWLVHVQGWDWVKAAKTGAAVALAIQFMPISPGSISRGLIVLFLMIKERDIRNYYIAAPVSFMHIIGYLAFPFQMVARDPALARFMAGRWATGLVRHIPVFGEHGALAEHAIFDLFFNLPLSLRRRFHEQPGKMWMRLALVLAFIAVAAYALHVLVGPMLHRAAATAS